METLKNNQKGIVEIKLPVAEMKAFNRIISRLEIAE